MSIPDDDVDGLAPQRMIDWLRSRTPEDWHFVADKLNWDSSKAVIDWILDQKSCDKATAAMMFWRSDAAYYLQYPNREAAAAAYGADDFDFIRKLVERWNGSFYTRSNIAFTPEPSDAYRRYLLEEAKYSAKGIPWQVNADIGDVRQGEAALSDAAYRKRYSDELARLLYALATDIPHPDRMHGSRGTFVGRLKGLFNLD
jgi:hypothetical protein